MQFPGISYIRTTPLRKRQGLLAGLLALSYCAAQAPAWALLTDMEKKWEKSYRTGSEALETNKYWIAEPNLRQSVFQAEHFGAADIRLAKSLADLGKLLTIRGRFAEAEPVLERELYVKQIALGNNNGETIASMGSLIKFYLEYGTESKAEPLTSEILDFVEGKIKEQEERKPGKVILRKGMTLDAYAGTAAPAMRDPLIEWAITCDALGNIYRMRKNYPMADRLYKAALDVKATVLGKAHLSLANSYDNLGTLCLEKKEYKEAESYYRDTLSCTEGVLEPSSPEVYNRLDKLAKCLGKAGKFAEAEALYLRARTFWKTEPSKSGDESRALFALGNLYLDQKRYSAAANVLAQALRMAERFNGPASYGLIPYLRQYAYACYFIGRRGDTEHLRARANYINGGVIDKPAPKVVAGPERPPVLRVARDRTPPINSEVFVSQIGATPVATEGAGSGSSELDNIIAVATSSATPARDLLHSKGSEAVSPSDGVTTTSTATPTSTATTTSIAPPASIASIASPASTAPPADTTVATSTSSSTTMTPVATSPSTPAPPTTLMTGSPNPSTAPTTTPSATPAANQGTVMPTPEAGVLLTERQQLVKLISDLQTNGINVRPYMVPYLAIEQQVRENVAEAKIFAAIERLSLAAKDQLRMVQKKAVSPAVSTQSPVTAEPYRDAQQK